MGVAVGFGNFFDLYDIFLGGVLAAVLAETWGLSTNGKALVIASGFGHVVGASTLGALADRIGRRRTFLMEILIYSAFTLAAAFSPNLAVLAILRFCAGIGLGGELSLADTYLSEILPRHVRGRYMAMAFTLSFFGVPLAAFIGAQFVADQNLLIDGWRWLLIVGSLGAAVVWALRRSLPESPRWHEIRGDHEAADRARSKVREIFEGPYRRRSTMLWTFQFLQTVVTTASARSRRWSLLPRASTSSPRSASRPSSTSATRWARRCRCRSWSASSART
jgi:MFS transporter, putative metabolite:H+ symporter